MSLTRPLNDITAQDTPTVGTKAVALGALRRAEFPVPNGFILTTEAYPGFIAPLREKIRARLTDDVIMDPAELESAATEIRAEIQAQAFPEALRAALAQALETLSDSDRASLIARSSVPGEDLATSFGSGVARAYLGLVGADEVERAAAQCWAALWNSRSMYYRYRKKIGQADVAFAVLVQPMVRADSAGVMFTQNPMSGDADEIQIRSIWGLGSPLTRARFRPDEFLVAKSGGQIKDRTIEEQVVQLVVGADGHIEEHALPPEKINAPSLTDAQVQNLAELGKRLETFFHAPQDIEWAAVGHEIIILQARPIAIRTA